MSCSEILEFEIRNQTMFSILIPTWNNLEMLKLCVRSIRQHSQYTHEIILHINEGSDGTREWAVTEGVKFTYSEKNIGICQAINWAFGLSTQKYIAYLNDDMYVLPGWDRYLMEEIQNVDNQLFMISSTMIEPKDSGARMVIAADYGCDKATFQEEKLLYEYQKYPMNDWSGSSFPPLVISREAWLLIGGFSIEFSPGMYSDPDLSMKLWLAGCRIFKGIGKSRVYHFMARSTGRVKKNNGRIQFMKKWGIPASAFYKYYLKMGMLYEGNLASPTEGRALKWERFKARVYCLFY
jgi:glycosyltransferase involved in cell wall biosynthesis